MARSSWRSKAITSVGSAAMQAEMVGSPVKTAMSPRKVWLSAFEIRTVSPGRRSTTCTSPRSIT